MAWDEREKHELELDEGRRNKAYKDQFGNYTIGVGHLLGKDEKYKDLEWTDEQVDEQFSKDFEEAVNGATEAFDGFVGLDCPRKGALVNMAFQLGGKSLSTFHTFLNLVDLGKYKEAAEDLITTRYAKQVPARAKRIAYRIQTGLYAER